MLYNKDHMHSDLLLQWLLTIFTIILTGDNNKRKLLCIWEIKMLIDSTHCHIIMIHLAQGQITLKSLDTAQHQIWLIQIEELEN